MSGQEAAPTQSPDGLTVLAALYGAELSFNTSLMTFHAILDAGSAAWSRESFAQRVSVDRPRMSRSISALQQLGVIRQEGEQLVHGGTKPLFTGTERLVDAAVDLNATYLGLVHDELPHIPQPKIKIEALGLLAIQHGIHITTPYPELIWAVSHATEEHPQHTIYRMLAAYAKNNRVASFVHEALRERVQTHPLIESSYRARRVVWRREERSRAS